MDDEIEVYYINPIDEWNRIKIPDEVVLSDGTNYCRQYIIITGVTTPLIIM